MRKIIAQSITFLQQEKTILYPTDTIWGIGCDATNKKAVTKIYELKERSESKSLIILVNSFEMLQNYVKDIPKEVIQFLKDHSKPTTVIYKNPINLAENVIANDKTIAIRIVFKGFVYELITAYNKPIVSTSANISGLKSPINFNEISKEIKEKVDYIVDLPQEKMTLKASTLIKLTAQNKFVILRK